MELKQISGDKLRNLKYMKKMLREGCVFVCINFSKIRNVIYEVDHVLIKSGSPDQIIMGGTVPFYKWESKNPDDAIGCVLTNIIDIEVMGSNEYEFTDCNLQYLMNGWLSYESDCFKEFYISDPKVGYLFYAIGFARRWMVEHGYHIEDPRGLPGYSDLLADAVEKLRAEGECGYGCGKLCTAAQNLLMLSNEAHRNGILALEDAVERLGIAAECEPKEAAFLDDMAKLLADEYDPKWIVEIMTNEYLTFAPEGIMAMCLYFYIRGGLMIMSGAANKEILRTLSRFLPKPWQGQFEEGIKGQGDMDERL